MAVLGRKKQAKVPPYGAVFRGVMRNKPGASQRVVRTPFRPATQAVSGARLRRARGSRRAEEQRKRMGGTRRRERPRGVLCEEAWCHLMRRFGTAALTPARQMRHRD